MQARTLLTAILIAGESSHQDSGGLRAVSDDRIEEVVGLAERIIKACEDDPNDITLNVYNRVVE